jgi:hypothetical protein
LNRNECPICRHVERSLIDHAISEGRPDSYLTNHFAADADSVRWHKENCLLGTNGGPVAAGGAAADHQEQLRELREAAFRIALEAAASDKHWRTALASMNTVSRLVLQEAKLRDRKRPAVPRLADSAEWQQLKVRILAVLDRFPDARQALMEALRDDA